MLVSLRSLGFSDLFYGSSCFATHPESTQSSLSRIWELVFVIDPCPCLDLIHGEYDAKDSAASQTAARGGPMAPLLIRGPASLLGFAPTAHVDEPATVKVAVDRAASVVGVGPRRWPRAL